MSNKVKRVPVNKLKLAMQPNVFTMPYGLKDDDFSFTVRRVLPLADVMQFVADVVSLCVDTETGEYLPEVRAFAIRSCVLTMYGNFTLPDDPEKQYDLLYNTDVFERVLAQVDLTQYHEILRAIDEKIAHEVAMLQSVAVRQAVELTSAMNKFIQANEAMFGSINSDDMNALVKNLSTVGKLDEEKVAKAVLNATYQTDAGKDGGSKVITLHTGKE